MVGNDTFCMMTFNLFSIHLEQNQGYYVLSRFIQNRRSLHPSDEDLSLGTPVLLVASTSAVRLRDTSLLALLNLPGLRCLRPFHLQKRFSYAMVRRTMLQSRAARG